MKSRTIAQLKKLIAEGLEKSTDGNYRLDISEDEFIECADRLSKWASSKRLDFIFRASPDALISDPLIEQKAKSSHDFRIALVDMAGPGWGFPKPFYVSDDCPSRADALMLAEGIQAKYPDAMLFIFPAEKPGKPDYWMTHYCVRAVHALDWLQYRYPAFTIPEAIHYLEVAEKKLGPTASRYMKGSYNRGRKTNAIVRAAHNVLMNDPKWKSAKQMAFVRELMTRTGMSERAIYQHMPPRPSVS